MSNQEEIKAVEKIVREVWQHFLDKDPEGMLKLLHPDCTVWDVFQPELVTRKEMEAYVEKDFSQSAARGKLTFKIFNFTTEVWENSAICRFNSYHKYASPNPHEGYGRTTCILRRFKKEGWLLVHVHEGALPKGIPAIKE